MCPCGWQHLPVIWESVPLPVLAPPQQCCHSTGQPGIPPPASVALCSPVGCVATSLSTCLHSWGLQQGAADQGGDHGDPGHKHLRFCSRIGKVGSSRSCIGVLAPQLCSYQSAGIPSRPE